MSKRIFNISVNELIKIGCGKEGAVYLSKDKRALKVYIHSSRCASECKMLMRLAQTSYFPKVYRRKGRFLLREYIEGTPLMEYLKEKGLSDTLAKNLIKLAVLFDEYKTIRLDGIDRHILVLNDESLKVIDPRNRKYCLYKKLLKVMERLGLYNEFVAILKDTEPLLYSKWLFSQ